MRLPKNKQATVQQGSKSDVNFNSIANIVEYKTGGAITDFYISVKNQAGIEQKKLSDYAKSINEALDKAIRNRDQFASLGFNYKVEVHPVDSFGNILWNKELMKVYENADGEQPK